MLKPAKYYISPDLFCEELIDGKTILLVIIMYEAIHLHYHVNRWGGDCFAKLRKARNDDGLE